MKKIQKHLTEMEVPFTIDPHIVRGLDYYGHTAFEYTSNHLGPTQNAVGGGGRYDVLVEQLGGRPYYLLWVWQWGLNAFYF